VSGTEKNIEQGISNLEGNFEVAFDIPCSTFDIRYSSALVVELVDTQDLKSCGQQWPYRFKSDPGHS
jgi:hypothetical protein